MEKLAILGGTPAIQEPIPESLFKWPIITQEHYDAAFEVIRDNSFSGTDITEKFQDEFAQWLNAKYAIAYCNGTMALSAAMFGVGLGKGDEIICPTKTYWGSVAQSVNFGASAVFCNINENLVMDPSDLERCISPGPRRLWWYIILHVLAIWMPLWRSPGSIIYM